MESKGDRSIFLQIADTIIEGILNGIYQPGEKIPSVRELALSVGVNPNTIMRTYTELQEQKIIDNKRGVGFFVSDQAKALLLDSKKKTFFESILPNLVNEAKLLGISSGELKAFFDQLEG